MTDQPPQDFGDPSDRQAYAGRWIALENNALLGVGATREEAIAQAQAQQPGAVLNTRLLPPPDDTSLFTILDLLRPVLPADMPLYVVGGAVRDHLLKRSIQDLDFVLPKNGIPIARKAANALGGEFYTLDAVRGTGRVLLFRPDGQRFVLDFAAQRGETLEEDLIARDFTINSLAIDVHAPKQVFDPLGGAMDIRSRRIHVCSDSSFEDDPLRVLRAIRMASTLGFSISAETRLLLRQSASKLPDVSMERLRDELLKILGGPKPAAVLRVMDILGVLPFVFPELVDLKGLTQPHPHMHDAWEHTLSTIGHLDNILGFLGALEHDPEVTGNLAAGVAVMRLGRFREKFHHHLESAPVPDRKWRSLLILAAAYHDTGKPHTRSLDETGRIRFLKHEHESAKLIGALGTTLKLSNAELSRLKRVVRHHMRPHFLVAGDGSPTRRAIYRFFRDTQEAGVDICLLNLADVLATYEQNLPPDLWKNYLDVIRELLENWWEKPDKTIQPPPLLNGRDVMAQFNLSSGRMIGILLERVQEAQATGEITNKEEAFELIEQILQD